MEVDPTVESYNVTSTTFDTPTSILSEIKKANEAATLTYDSNSMRIYTLTMRCFGNWREKLVQDRVARTF